MKFFRIVTLICLILMPSFLTAEVFIDWKAGYYVEYPDSWYHVSYRTVNIFLQTQEINPDEFDYDAVLAMKSDKPFFEMPYIFLSFDPAGQLSDRQIDSVVNQLSKEYGRDYIEGSLTGTDRNFNLGQPVYDRKLRAIAVKGRVSSEYIDKILLEIRRFYDKGVAIFLCYAPKEMYEDVRPDFLSIFNSFSTRDLDKVAPKEEVKIVDVSQRELDDYDEEDFPEPGTKDLSSSGIILVLIIVLAIILLAAIIFFIFKRK
nr:hypothetical protein [candidate division Zixibacteria bacterium]